MSKNDANNNRNPLHGWKGILYSVRTLASWKRKEDTTECKTHSLPFLNKKPTRSYVHTIQAFLAGTAVGALSVLATLNYSAAKNASDEAATRLINERSAEKQTLTPLIADIDLPIENPSETDLDGVLQAQSSNVTDDSIPEQLENQETIPPEPDILEKFTIKPRQNLYTVLKKGGLTNREIHLITEALSDVLDPKKIQVGDLVEVGKMTTEEKNVSLLSVTIEDRHGRRYIASRNEADSFEASLVEPEVDLKTEYAEGTINGAFIKNAKEAGIPTNVIHQIIWAFDGPVDFSRDLRKGDTFTAVFEKEYNKDGKPTGNGNLLYAVLNLRSKKYERYLYKDSKNREDYYDETGKIARKLFTIHPLNKPRQTSKFGKRKHPILGYTIMHWGADFGAPTGTPIRSPGEGTITQVKKNNSYGLYVQIKHNSEYSTAYAHMSKFHEKTKVGRKVKAGDIIGYVGNTGRSTGPHLHWELIKNGKKINPLTQRITAQRKLTGEELKRFYVQRDIMRNNVSGEIVYARAESLPEERKSAYQGSTKTKKTTKKSKKASLQKTASRNIQNHNG